MLTNMVNIVSLKLTPIPKHIHITIKPFFNKKHFEITFY